MSLILALVPARGGSKGIPKKNLAMLCGKPLISYTLGICKKIEVLGATLVSTNDEEIAKFCSAQGFHTDYRRPAHLATDEAPMIDAVLHAVNWYETKHSCIVDHVLLLQPTSPLRRIQDITSALKQYRENNLDSLVGVTPMWEHPFECIEAPEDGSEWSYLKKPSKLATRRQDYQGRFGFIDGSIYIASVDFIKQNLNFVVEGKTFLFFIDQRYSIDIDEPDDLKMAEIILKDSKGGTI